MAATEPTDHTQSTQLPTQFATTPHIVRRRALRPAASLPRVRRSAAAQASIGATRTRAIGGSTYFSDESVGTGDRYQYLIPARPGHPPRRPLTGVDDTDRRPRSPATVVVGAPFPTRRICRHPEPSALRERLRSAAPRTDSGESQNGAWGVSGGAVHSAECVSPPDAVIVDLGRLASASRPYAVPECARLGARRARANPDVCRTGEQTGRGLPRV